MRALMCDFTLFRSKKLNLCKSRYF